MNLTVRKALLLLILFIIIAFLGGWLLYWKSLDVISVTYEVIDKKIYATVELFNTYLSGECVYDGEVAKIENNKCILEVPNESVNITVKTKVNSIEVESNPKQSLILDFLLSFDELYLIKGEEREVNVTYETIGSPVEEVKLASENEDIATVSGNVITAVGNGKTNILVTAGDVKKTISVTSTDLITKPILNKDKASLPCGVYSYDDSVLLDEYLKRTINEAGYKTRAGVVAALRFLTLQLPYKIDYFFENGRLNNNTGGRYVDGEGRFYHEGLYLNEDKFNSLLKFGWGPATWGCPLTNWEDDGKYKPYRKYPNGLDCSGFVTWAMLNGGFDVKDTGAGDTSYVSDDLGDLGPHTPLTRELLESGRIKSGDYIASDGHAALVGGITNDHIYVAESTTYWDGVVMHEYTFDEVLKMPFLTYVILMDDYYKEQGVYTEYWE